MIPRNARKGRIRRLIAGFDPFCGLIGADRVKPGRVMIGIDGVNEAIAREALRLCAMKLPIKSRVVVREDL